MPVLPVAEVVKNQDGEFMFKKDGKVRMKINQVKVDIYNEQVKSYVKKEERLESTPTSLYHVTWDQCIKLPKKIERSTRIQNN